jgi:transposase
MRGTDRQEGSLFSYVNLETRVPANHPLRPIRTMVDEALKGLDAEFERMYADEGRPSIAPERLLRALLLQLLYSVRSERMLMEQLDYNLLFRWFVGLGVDDEVWVPTTFTKNRDRLLKHEISRKFFDQVLGQARGGGLLSDEHFTLDATLLEAWASHKSFKRKDDTDDKGGPAGRNMSVNFKGEVRSNDTHASTTDADARLRAKKGEGAKLVHQGHVLTENRHGLVVATEVTRAEGNTEAETADKLLCHRGATRRGTIAGDKAYDQHRFVETVRAMNMTPHVAQNITTVRGSTIDRRTTRHEGYAVSQRRRKMVEEAFGWMKTVGLLRKLRHRGTKLVGWIFEFAAAAYNLVRMRSLMRNPHASV